MSENKEQKNKIEQEAEKLKQETEKLKQEKDRLKREAVQLRAKAIAKVKKRKKWKHTGKRLRQWGTTCAVGAFLITLLIETLARQTVTGGFVFLAEHPLVFAYNALIVFTCLSFCMLFRHRIFVFVLIGSVWTTLGIINGLILSNRMTPFTTNDIKEVKDGMSIATNYFSTAQMVEIGLGIIAIVGFVVLLFLKAPVRKNRTNFRMVIPGLLIVCMMMAGGTSIAVRANIVDTYFPNLAYGYRDNGFCYCFVATWLDKGVSRPDNYTADTIRGIFTKKELNTTVGYSKMDTAEKHPNIIFLQLESFVDPQIAEDVKLDRDAIPYYHELMKKYSTGKIQVPSMGAGTANTEFESMTGMSVKFFGPGEYPYKTVLLDKSCESIPFDLRNIGYATHCIHNHRGAFYNRNKVLGNLGFETFTSLEYMRSVTKTPKNWAKDYVLTDEIMDTLKETPGSDYIYTISVQGHGKYPTEELIKDPKVKVLEADTDELKWQWEYYANQVYEMDEFVKELTDTLSKFKEDTVLVMYGDHLPAMSDLTDDNLVEGRNIYQTDYIIWDNFGMKKKDMDIYAYQIGAELLDRLDIHNGTMVTYHQNHRKSKTYLADLEALQYDILYGDRYIYNAGGKMPYAGLDLKMGVKDIKISEVVQIAGKYYIKGENFTEYSKINLDGEILDTVFLGPTILGLNEEVDPADVGKMKISQVEKGNEILSTTEQTVE